MPWQVETEVALIVHTGKSHHRQAIYKYPYYNLHVLQRDGHLTVWQVEWVRLRLPSLHQLCDQAMVNVYIWDPK